MDEYERLTRQHYGALEIKRSVGLNLIRGLVVSVMLHGALISIPVVAGMFGQRETTVKRAGPVIIRIEPSPRFPQPERWVFNRPKPENPINKIYTPVVEEPVADSTGHEPKAPKGDGFSGPDTGGIDALGGTGGSGGMGNGTDPLTIIEEPIPPESVFIPFEIAPQKLTDLCPPPEFPELAKMARMNGKVTVNVYVDRFGNVKKWKIIQANPPDLGFEDEVLKVITKWKFTPAIQQGRAVGVWVAVPITFTFKNKER